MGTEIQINLAALESFQALGSTQASALHRDGERSADTAMHLEDVKRSISAMVPALVASEYVDQMMDAFDFDTVIALAVLPRWVRVGAEGMSEAFGLQSRLVNDESAKAALSSRDAVRDAKYVAGIVFTKMTPAGPESTLFGRGTRVSTPAFAMLVVLAAHVFLVSGEFDAYRRIAAELSGMAQQMDVGAELFGLIADTISARA